MEGNLGTMVQPTSRTVDSGLATVARRAIDLAVSGLVLLLALPVLLAVAAAIKLDSPGPVFFRCRRVGFHGAELLMLKFRKMRDGAAGAAVTLSGDERFTRVGRFLARTKLDELPQLWHVLTGEMTLVGPRPEDRAFVEVRAGDYAKILTVKPGVTGLCQLAFAKEGDVLRPDDRIRDYVERLLPQKAALDVLYVGRRSLPLDLRILAWTAVTVLGRRDVAVHRASGKLGLRRRPRQEETGEAVPAGLGLKP
jgi:lipopolysaccharide/colanic/teichoic acid biosynthesis glycosyltransferase